MCPHCGRDHRAGIAICPVAGLAMSEPGVCGTTIDRYQVLERIGQGGFGTVYRGRHVHTLRDVAIKLLDREVTKDPSVLQRFEREAQVVSAIKSRHVVEVYDYGVLPGGQAFLVMELLDGSDLSTVIDPKARLSIVRALELADQLFSGLAAVHAAGAIHRDLKPSNIFLARDGERDVVKLLDFGCARARDRVDDRLLATRTGMTIGTPLYMAPEQLRAGTVDARSDVYSAAVVVYELLSGQRPHEGTTYDDLVVRVCTEEPRSLAGLAGVPDHVAAPVMRGLERDPSKRWQSADAFARALRGEFSAETVKAETMRDVPTAAARGSAPSFEAIAMAQTRAAPITETPAAPAAPTVSHRPTSPARKYLPLAGVLIVGAAGGVIVPRLLAEPSTPPVAPDAALVAKVEPDAAPPPPADAPVVVDAPVAIITPDAAPPRPRPIKRVPRPAEPDGATVVKQVELVNLRERVRQIEAANRDDQQKIFEIMRKQGETKEPETRMALGREIGTLQIGMTRRSNEAETLNAQIKKLETEVAPKP